MPKDRNHPPAPGEAHYFEAGEPVPYWLERVIPPFAMLIEFTVAVRVRNSRGRMVVQPLSKHPQGRSLMHSDKPLSAGVAIVIGGPTYVNLNPVDAENDWNDEDL